ncbi:MAG: Calx-beta domain-containing protein [Verrucomicrobiota bacterium]
MSHKNFFYLFPGIFSSLCAAWFAVTAPLAGAATWIADNYSRQTIYHSPQTPGYTSWVGAWVMPDGSLMAMCHQPTGPIVGRTNANYDYSGLQLANIYLRSTNGGANWSKVGEDLFSSFSDRPVWGGSHCALTNGGIIRAVDGSQLPSNAVPRTIYFQRSMDQGQTWGPPEIPPEPLRPLQYTNYIGDFADYLGRVRRVSDGRLLATGVKRYNPSTATRLLGEPVLMFSSNDGVTWNPQTITLSGIQTNYAAWNEWDTAELPSGDFLGVFRRNNPTNSSQQVRYQGRFHKTGSTWILDQYGPAPFPHSGHPELLATREGPILHIATTGIHWTDDGGATWNVLNITGVPSYSSRYYPRSIQTSDGTIYVFGHVGSDDYYGRTDQSVTMDRFRLVGDVPIVTIRASIPNSAEPSTPGQFTISRSGNTSSNLTVSYTISGTASNGVDYVSLTGSATITTGSSNAIVTVSPIDDNVVEGNETVVLTLAANAGYSIGLPSNATVTFMDNDFITNLKIMPMGDSITEGTIPGGYRLPLYNLLQTNGYTIDFVGAKTQIGDTCPDPNHWGKSGWQISDTPATIEGRSYVSIQGQNRSGLYDEMTNAVALTYFSTNVTTRNIILLLIGVNDHLHQVVDSAHGSFNTDLNNDGQGEGQDWIAEGCIARLQSLLHEIDVRAASQGLQIDVLVSTTPPITKAWTGDAVSDVITNEVVQYNSFIMSAIPTNVFSNITVELVDQYTALVGNLADGVHPTAAGYQSMAQVWYQAILNTLPLPTITLTATSPNAAEPSTPGVLTVNRSGSTSNTLTVSYTISGTAGNGVDYANLPGSITLLTGVSGTNIIVTPLDDSLVEGNETVVLTLVTNAGYTVGSPGSATVIIADNDAPAVTQATEPFDNASDVLAHGWTGVGNTNNGNNFGFSNTDNTGFGSPAGEGGGVLARTVNVSYYGDTTLGATFTLTNTLHADGELAITAASTSPLYDNAVMIGFFNSIDGGAVLRKNVLGLTIAEPVGGGQGTYRARPTFALSDGATVQPSAVISLTPGNSRYKFAADYNPTNGVNGQGRLTVQVFNSSGASLATLTQDLTAAQRNTGASFNGYGLLTGGLGAANSGDAITLYFDQLTYSAASPNTVQPFLFSSPQRLGNGLFQFTISGAAGQGFILEGSTNLSQWLPLSTNTLTNGAAIYSDPQSSNFVNRLYRAKKSP